MKKIGIDFLRDPWKNRNRMIKCNTCIYFVIKDSINKGEEYPREYGYIGRCRRHAPSIIGFPVVFELDWCGDHRLDENAV